MIDNDMLTLIGLLTLMVTALTTALCKALEHFSNGKAIRKINMIGKKVVGMDKKFIKIDNKVNKIESMVKADMMVSMNVIEEYEDELAKWYHPVYQELVNERLKGGNGNGNN